MRCTNKIIQRLLCGVVIGSLVCLLAGCGGRAFDLPYEVSSPISSLNVVETTAQGTSHLFADDLCVIPAQAGEDGSLDMSQAESAVIVDVNNKSCLYTKNPHETLFPASLTKVMTAVIALKNASPDKVLVATDSVNVSERGAQLLGLKSGDTMTLDQAIRILLIYSANDVAVLIAENIGGSVEGFVDMMNREAAAIGATRTHFTNPHGLSDADHYTTAYDLYLIFNQAIQYELFRETINMTSYQTTYYSSDGTAKPVSIENTNQYLKNVYAAPENVTVIGGKTGTTNAAGHCLILLSRDVNGAPYISVILKATDRESLYVKMTELLGKINK